MEKFSMHWKKYGVATVLAAALAGPGLALANNQAVNQAQQTAYEARQVSVDSGVSLLDNLRSAVLASYMVNNNWPVSPAAVVASGYTSTATSVWGMAVAGTVTGGGNSYTLSLTAPTLEVAMGISGRLGAPLSGNTVNLIVPVPASASVLENAVNRFAVVGRPELNLMQTALDMNDHNINNVDVLGVNTVIATTLNGGLATLDTLLVNTAFTVVPDAAFNRNVNVAQKLTAGTEVEAPVFRGTTLIVDGGTVNGALAVASLNSSGEIIAAKVTTPQVVADAVIVNGALAADSAVLGDTSVATLIANDTDINGLLRVTGPSEFVSDALFRGNVTVNGALTVAGITSAADIREGGVLLREKYLGINAKAKDTDKLDGQDSTFYRNAANLNSGVLAAERLAGLYDIDISGRAAIASNAEKLGGVEASNYARTNIAETFGSNVTVNGRIYAKSGLHVQGDWVRVDGTKGIYFQSYGGGWHMQDTTWLRAYGGKSVYTTGVIRGDAGLQVGSGVVVADGSGRLRYMNQDLDARYLKIGAKAADANLLDGIDSSKFARRDTNNTLTGTNTFTQTVNANGGIKVDGKWIASSNGTTLYENGVALPSKYLAKSAKAADANLLDGIDSSRFARRDAANTFTQPQTFNAGITTTTFNATSAATLASLVVNSTARIKGTLYAEKGIEVGSAYDVKVGSISLKDHERRLKDLEIASGGGGGGTTTVFSGETQSFTLPSGYSSFKADYKVVNTNDGTVRESGTTIVFGRLTSATLASRRENGCYSSYTDLVLTVGGGKLTGNSGALTSCGYIPYAMKITKVVGMN
ncbi:shufflon system plasmid conjugative transfer pilus tip adhesin PilV [Agarivorans sp. B2Z047]|uniref:shufflon system plasmid conjugative transfer pilus tip adhesin PilV n=1 Tax=Agarivorans sp. B2Z047 TaxID=2652721 RepID=UPI0018834D0C|nr:shufflon system plasmid conjugative transfer pilus tip adhesin PilV [Agarivorans sp. B2Z047]UQN43901.1 shufflon system plasmid conjugative transfer pilus tip adhesin PilV [Agarivorans sp. B2Z047]